MPLYDLSLKAKLKILVRVYWPNKPEVKSIPLTEHHKSLFAPASELTAKFKCINGDYADFSYKIGIDQSGDKVYWFYVISPDIAHRIRRSSNPPDNPTQFILEYIIYKEKANG